MPVVVGVWRLLRRGCAVGRMGEGGVLGRVYGWALLWSWVALSCPSSGLGGGGKEWVGEF